MKGSREFKGNSLLEDVSDYVAIDLETTGLDPTYDDIIEFGAVKVSNGIIIDKFQSLINPGYEISPFIATLTGISNEMLASAPSLVPTFSKFIEFLGNYTIVGHNVNFDINFIYDACVNNLGVAFSNNFIDTMRLSRRIFPEEKHHRLSDVSKRFSIGENVEHRALSDAIKVHECYESIKKFLAENNISFSSLYPHTTYKHSSIRAKDIVPTIDVPRDTSPFFKKIFVFTGTLEHKTRKEAMQMVVNLGGLCGDRVTKQTDFLVLGNTDYCKTIKDGKSSKQKRAEQLKLSGSNIEILSENVFYDMMDSETFNILKEEFH